MSVLRFGSRVLRSNAKMCMTKKRKTTVENKCRKTFQSQLKQATGCKTPHSKMQHGTDFSPAQRNAHFFIHTIHDSICIHIY